MIDWWIVILPTEYYIIILIRFTLVYRGSDLFGEMILDALIHLIVWWLYSENNIVVW